MKDSNFFNEDLLSSLHSTFLDGDDILIDYCQQDGISIPFASLIVKGEYRHQSCVASHHEKGYEVEFCNHFKIKREMEWYFTEARKLLSNADLNPYTVSAWLQWAFLRIHPFQDGNGRVARMISSIPLVGLYLPPIVVVSSSKKKYFKALQEADDFGNIETLALFLKEEAVKAIDFIQSLTDLDGESLLAD